MSHPSRKSRVLAAVDDLFFSARIEAVARSVGIGLALASDSHQLWSRLQVEAPDLVILDLNSKSCAPLDSIHNIRSEEKQARTKIIGFLSHVQTELERAARNAGCHSVLPWSKFSAELPKILMWGGPS